ncbi:MAG: hypothetical protein Kow0029_05590 [Candidatus Rifleibacteriota bacterium]
MLINIFNAILIIGITYVTYKYFALRESMSPVASRTAGYIARIGDMVDKIEGYDSSHSLEMADLAELLGKEKGLGSEEIESLRIAAYMHDIGEVLLPREIFRSTGKLDSEKTYLMRTHPLLGELQLRNKDFPFDEVPVLIRWHHEKWDGTGYPDNLKGEEIPLAARILSLVDAVSAMKSERPYRGQGMKMNDIIKELDRLAGLQFDPELVELYKHVLKNKANGEEND